MTHEVHFINHQHINCAVAIVQMSNGEYARRVWSPTDSPSLDAMVARWDDVPEACRIHTEGCALWCMALIPEDHKPVRSISVYRYTGLVSNGTRGLEPCHAVSRMCNQTNDRERERQQEIVDDLHQEIMHLLLSNSSLDMDDWNQLMFWMHAARLSQFQLMRFNQRRAFVERMMEQYAYTLEQAINIMPDPQNPVALELGFDFGNRPIRELNVPYATSIEQLRDLVEETPPPAIETLTTGGYLTPEQQERFMQRLNEAPITGTIQRILETPEGQRPMVALVGDSPVGPVELPQFGVLGPPPFPPESAWGDNLHNIDPNAYVRRLMATYDREFRGTPVNEESVFMLHQRIQNENLIARAFPQYRLVADIVQGQLYLEVQDEHRQQVHFSPPNVQAAMQSITEEYSQRFQNRAVNRELIDEIQATLDADEVAAAMLPQGHRIQVIPSRNQARSEVEFVVTVQVDQNGNPIYVENTNGTSGYGSDWHAGPWVSNSAGTPDQTAADGSLSRALRDQRLRLTPSGRPARQNGEPYCEHCSAYHRAPGSWEEWVDIMCVAPCPHGCPPHIDPRRPRDDRDTVFATETSLEFAASDAIGFVYDRERIETFFGEVWERIANSNDQLKNEDGYTTAFKVKQLKKFMHLVYAAGVNHGINVGCNAARTVELRQQALDALEKGATNLKRRIKI